MAQPGCDRVGTTGPGRVATALLACARQGMGTYTTRTCVLQRNSVATEISLSRKTWAVTKKKKDPWDLGRHNSSSNLKHNVVDDTKINTHPP